MAQSRFWSDYGAGWRNVLRIDRLSRSTRSSGVVLQTIMFARSFIRGNYNKSHFCLSANTQFWHFVDVIWVILFSLIYLWQT